jgi:hypothetical protein
VAIVAVAVVAGLLLSSTWGSGTVQFLVHDAPCSQCAHVWVTFATVSVHEAGTLGGRWVEVNVSGARLDIQALNGSGAAKLLGIGSLPVGHYEQVQIVVSNVTVQLLDGSTLFASVTGPSGDFNGQFDVKQGATTILDIDVDLASSLHLTPGPGGSMTASFTPDIAEVGVSGP